MTETEVHIKSSSFDQLYTSLRQKEGRVYNDEEVLHLPDISKDHPHYSEWQMRKESCRRLKHYFEKKLSPLKILEAGCGNGWLTRRLAGIPGSHITGTDINNSELQQAIRAFKHVPNLKFIRAGITDIQTENEKFDLIVFAASIQYFPSLKEIISQAMLKLKTNGEIHILDSVFYEPGEIKAAKERSATYYRELGFPEMTRHYFHHSTEELNFARFKTLYQPSFFNRLSNNKNPFPWFCIMKQ
jgi:ubiquinone/menaquinone biosynthesis C-methylase UbiE